VHTHALQESVNLGLTWIKAFGIYEKMVPENEGGILTPHNIHLNCSAVENSSPFACKWKHSSGPKPLNLQQFKMIFMIIGAGYIFASLSFTLEVIVAYCMKRYKVESDDS